MEQISIPAPLYSEVQRVALTSGISVESLVAFALESYLHDEPAIYALTPEQIDIVRRGQAEIRAGGGMASDDLRDELEAHKKAWLLAHPR